MRATLSLSIELSEPTLIRTADDLRRLDRSKLQMVEIRLAPQGEDTEASAIVASADPMYLTVAEIVNFADRVQPEGTKVEIRYQGRSEWMTI